MVNATVPLMMLFEKICGIRNTVLYLLTSGNTYYYINEKYRLCQFGRKLIVENRVAIVKIKKEIVKKT